MASGYVFGALAGVSVQLYANAVRRLPLMTSPWEHVALGAAGAVVGDYIVRYTERAERETNAELARRAELNKALRDKG